MMREGLNLIELGVGYFVWVTASKEKKTVKLFGRGIAILIMFGAALAILCASMKCLADKGCPFSGMKSRCPIMSKAMCSFSRKS